MSASPGGSAGAMLAAMEQRGGKPLRAMIEIADRCNEVCVHCYQEQGLKGEMSTAELCAVIDELAEMGILILTVSGGEATLRKDFLEIMRHARARGFVLRLFTNGLTMTAELARELHALAVDVVEISLYSHRAEVHDFVTGVPGSFERTVAGIRHLVAVGVTTHVKTPVMRVNEDELEEFVDFAESLGASYALDPQVLSAREYATLEPAALDRSEQAAAGLLRNPRFDASPVVADVAPEKRHLCGAGETVHIEPNGDVRPCVVLPMTLGNAREPGGLQASRESEARRGLTSLTWADVHGCRECELQAYCGRCHAQALAEGGDALGPYASACDNAVQRYEWIEARTLPVRGGPVGPFRLRDGVAEAFEDRVTADDDARAARLGWVRTERAEPVQRAVAAPGALVQLRRPGRKRARPERVPASAGWVAGGGE